VSEPFTDHELDDFRAEVREGCRAHVPMNRSLFGSPAAHRARLARRYHDLPAR
jgi:hypothetical protein